MTTEEFEQWRKHADEQGENYMRYQNSLENRKMRPRGELLTGFRNISGFMPNSSFEETVIEVLCDIRDLLSVREEAK